MDWSPKELHYMHLLQDSGYPMNVFLVQLHCTKCPWACIKEVRSSKLSGYYSAEEVYKCPLCKEVSVECRIET